MSRQIGKGHRADSVSRNAGILEWESQVDTGKGERDEEGNIRIDN